MKPRFESKLAAASDAALDMVVRPFIAKFVRPDKRERATSLYLPRSSKTSWHELLEMIDTARAQPYSAEVLAPWNAVTGVFLVDQDAYTVSTHMAMGLYLNADALFIAYRGTFAVVRYKKDDTLPLLLT